MDMGTKVVGQMQGSLEERRAQIQAEIFEDYDAVIWADLSVQFENRFPVLNTIRAALEDYINSYGSD
jgi:hypothetical protein